MGKYIYIFIVLFVFFVLHNILNYHIQSTPDHFTQVQTTDPKLLARNQALTALGQATKVLTNAKLIEKNVISFIKAPKTVMKTFDEASKEISPLYQQTNGVYIEANNVIIIATTAYQKGKVVKGYTAQQKAQEAQKKAQEALNIAKRTLTVIKDYLEAHKAAEEKDPQVSILVGQITPVPIQVPTLEPTMQPPEKLYTLKEFQTMKAQEQIMQAQEPTMQTQEVGTMQSQEVGTMQTPVPMQAIEVDTMQTPVPTMQIPVPTMQAPDQTIETPEQFKNVWNESYTSSILEPFWNEVRLQTEIVRNTAAINGTNILPIGVYLNNNNMTTYAKC